jgi:hypothetical protein
MTWAQRLKRVFGIDRETCLHCGGAVRILASVEEPDAIRWILENLDGNRLQYVLREEVAGPAWATTGS